MAGKLTVTEFKLTVTELKKHLRSLTPQQLAEDIVELYKRYSDVKEYYQVACSGDDSAVLDRYKAIVRNEFMPPGRQMFPKMRLSVARKAVSDFKKIAKSKEAIADLMLVYVESGVLCTITFGDIDVPFYNSMESMFEAALDFIDKNDLFDEFRVRLKAIVDGTRGIGWGFHDNLSWCLGKYENL
jgi:hypothetical protein